MGCVLYGSIPEYQTTSSAPASGEIERGSPHDCLDSNTEYRLQVKNQLTGRKPILTEIIFSSILAKKLTLIRVEHLASFSVTNLHSGTRM